MNLSNNNNAKMENSSQNINVGNDALKKIETDKMSQDVKKDERAHEDESLEVIVDKRIIFLNAAKLKGGEVYACYLDKKQEVALKKIDLNQISEFKGVISGLEKFKEKSHDNIVKYLHYAEKNNFFYIAMEMGTQENLMDHDCKATDIKRFFQSITNGLDYLHDNEIVHGALDPSNIQLFKRSDGTIYPKLSNYALKKVTLSDDGKNFVAPEVYKGGEKILSSDIFSLFGIFYYMHSDGLFPIQYGKRGSKFIFNYLGEGKRFFQQNIDFSYFAPDLMDKMRAEDPNDRPTIKEVLEDPYFWTAEKLMSFLTKIHSKNDGKTSDFIKFKEALNKKKDIIFGANVANWTSKIDAELLKNINDRRPSSYPLSSVLDLVLSIRNKHHHREDADFLKIKEKTLEENIRGTSLEDIAASHLNYWGTRFPELFTQVIQEYRNHFTN